MTAAAELELFHPAKKLYRFTVLLFVSILTYGSYFAYDSVGAIPNLIMESMNIDHTQLGMLYSFYSWPNLVMVFIGGVIIDRIGTRKASLFFSCLIVLGAAVVAAAPNFTVMLIGRVIFGIGSESLIVAQCAIVAKWFKGKELALAFGITLTISRLGTMFSFNTEAMIAKAFGGMRPALWAAVIFCIVSLISNLIYIVLDRRGEKALKLIDEGVEDKIVFADVKKLPRSFWLISLLCVTFYSAIFPFTAFSTDMFLTKFGLPETIGSYSGGVFGHIWHYMTNMFTTAGGTTSIIIFASMCLAPFAGHMVDRFGRRGTLMMFGSLMMIPCYLIMGFTSIYPAIPMALLGMAFVLVPAAMWPAVPLIVKKEVTGTAYGLMTAIQNLGLAVFPLIIGGLRSWTNTYKASMVVFSLLGVGGLIFALLLKRGDLKSGGGLEKIKTG